MNLTYVSAAQKTLSMHPIRSRCSTTTIA